MNPGDEASPPGAPGIAARWTSSAKSGVGTSAGATSRVWFAVSHGIVDEVYYPSFDKANTRDLGLLVTDRDQFSSEEKRDTLNDIEMLAPGVPGFRMHNVCRQGRYEIEKIVLTDPAHDVLVQKIRFRAIQGQRGDYSLFVLLAPHIGNRGAENNGWVGDYKGEPMLFAERAGVSMALACSLPFSRRSCGYVGTSDGWQDIQAHKRMTVEYAKASNGNIALTAEIDLATGRDDFVLVLGFGHSPEEAALQARATLLSKFDKLVEDYTQEWQQVQTQFRPLDETATPNSYRVSTSVLRVHSSKSIAGGMIASLSIPWGASMGDDNLGGYHLVWPRDLCESAGGLLAAGDAASARQSLTFLMATQEADGHWPQNMWFTGQSYWGGLQMDETAFPILLADSLRRERGLEGIDVWPMVLKAASFIVCNGPVTQEDRWEEDGGYSPFTLAVEIASLVAAADFADDAGAGGVSAYLRATADAWNSLVEHWTYVTDTDLARQVGVKGYYVRISPPDEGDTAALSESFVPIKNRALAGSNLPVGQVVSPDALALVRFGLRSAADERIKDTLRVIDALLKTETATGPVWHRYDNDGYGEHNDGSAFDGFGVGRGWPLLAGERAHYELAAGNVAEAARLLRVIEAQTSPGGLIPEQVWDAADIPDRELFNGHPSGSAMPLVWAHAEHVKLLRSLSEGRVFDLPPQVAERYARDSTLSRVMPWRFNQKCRVFAAGQILRVETRLPARVHWSPDGWRTVSEADTTDSGIGMHYVDLSTEDLAAGSTVKLTFFWPEEQRWEGIDFDVLVTSST